MSEVSAGRSSGTWSGGFSPFSGFISASSLYGPSAVQMGGPGTYTMMVEALKKMQEETPPRLRTDIFTGSKIGGKKSEFKEGFGYARDLAKRLKGKPNILDTFKTEFGDLADIGGYFGPKGLVGNPKQFGASQFVDLKDWGWNPAGGYFNFDRGLFDPTGQGNFSDMEGGQPPNMIFDQRLKNKLGIQDQRFRILGKRGVKPAALDQSVSIPTKKPKRMPVFFGQPWEIEAQEIQGRNPGLDLSEYRTEMNKLHNPNQINRIEATPYTAPIDIPIPRFGQPTNKPSITDMFLSSQEAGGPFAGFDQGQSPQDFMEYMEQTGSPESQPGLTYYGNIPHSNRAGLQPDPITGAYDRAFAKGDVAFENPQTRFLEPGTREGPFILPSSIAAKTRLTGKDIEESGALIPVPEEVGLFNRFGGEPSRQTGNPITNYLESLFESQTSSKGPTGIGLLDKFISQEPMGTPTAGWQQRMGELEQLAKDGRMTMADYQEYLELRNNPELQQDYQPDDLRRPELPSDLGSSLVERFGTPDLRDPEQLLNMFMDIKRRKAKGEEMTPEEEQLLQEIEQGVPQESFRPTTVFANEEQEAQPDQSSQIANILNQFKLFSPGASEETDTSLRRALEEIRQRGGI